eukprot:TRINITY_DN3001_c0_g1_i2.p1 TRINITY_DN3001_c0_g1~~TRINITY_DN3001_c0_g1_i2.p1  ORF type:complete len:368 (+),score=75.60 TRINITY_DN3001_c0_g1_i2:25-1128(+)
MLRLFICIVLVAIAAAIEVYELQFIGTPPSVTLNFGGNFQVNARHLVVVGGADGNQATAYFYERNTYGLWEFNSNFTFPYSEASAAGLISLMENRAVVGGLVVDFSTELNTWIPMTRILPDVKSPHPCVQLLDASRAAYTSIISDQIILLQESNQLWSEIGELQTLHNDLITSSMAFDETNQLLFAPGHHLVSGGLIASSVYVFNVSAAGSTGGPMLQQVITPEDAGHTWLGEIGRVGLTAQNGILVASLYNSDTSLSGVAVYQLVHNGTYVLESTLQSKNEGLGGAIALHGDLLVVSRYLDMNPAVVELYNVHNLTEPLLRVADPHARVDSWFGSFVALVPDLSQLLIGDPLYGRAGSVYVYELKQ